MATPPTPAIRVADADRRKLLRLAKRLRKQGFRVSHACGIHPTLPPGADEIQIAADIQQMLLLDRPPTDVPGFVAASVAIPSKAVDGDFIDFIRHGPQCVDVIVGDVMGKGVPAALVSAAAKSEFLRSLSELNANSETSGLPRPEQIVMAAHNRLTPQLIELESFITLCYARVDLAASRLELVDCGHTKPILLKADGKSWQTLSTNNLPLGVVLWEVYRQISIPIAPGDILVFYSDGVTEARNPLGEMFGFDRLLATVRRYRRLGPNELVRAVRTAVAEFVQRETFTDDLTCLAVKVSPAPGRPPIRQGSLELASNPDQKDRLREFLRAYCDENALAHIEPAALALFEHINRDAYRGMVDRRVRVEATARDDRIEVDFRHWGSASTPPAWPRECCLEETDYLASADGGYRIHIAKRRKIASVR